MKRLIVELTSVSHDLTPAHIESIQLAIEAALMDDWAVPRGIDVYVFVPRSEEGK
jgi:hypothetical protein